MPGGYQKIRPADGRAPFTKENQPPNRGRKSTKILTDLLTKQLKSKKDIMVTGIDPLTDKQITIRVPMPTREVIIGALLRQAAKGNLMAIKEIFDRTEGKAMQPVEIEDGLHIHVTRI